MNHRGVVAAFDASYAALPSPARRLVGPLSAASENGLAPATLSTLAGLDGEETRRALCELVDAHVARPAGSGHYALTDAWLRFGVHRRPG